MADHHASPSWFSPALLQLARLQLTAGLRGIVSQLKTPTGIFIMLLGVMTLSFMLLPAIVSLVTAGDSQRTFMVNLSRAAPIGFYLALVVVLVSDASVPIIELKPPEMQFVLAGPFSDSQILTYRLLTLMQVWLPLSLFGAVTMAMYVPNIFLAWLSIFLGGTFLVIIGVTRALAISRLSPSFKTVLSLIAVGSFIAMIINTTQVFSQSGDDWSLIDFLIAMSDSPLGRILTLPVMPFARIMQAGEINMLIFPISLAVLSLSCVLALCYRINSGFAELAVQGIAQRDQRVKAMQSGGMNPVARPSSATRSPVPVFSYLSGLGPLVWLQLTTFWRRAGRLAVMAIVLSAIACTLLPLMKAVEWISIPDRIKPHVIYLAMAASSYVAFIYTAASMSGFAVKPSKLSLLKTLAIPSLPMASGLAIGGSIPLIGLRLMIFLPACVLTSATWPNSLAVLFLGFAIDLALATSVGLVCSSTNLRLVPDGNPDILQGGRAMLFMLLLGLGILPTTIVAGVSGLVVGLFTSFYLPACLLAAGAAAVIIQPIGWMVTGLFFEQRELP